MRSFFRLLISRWLHRIDGMVAGERAAEIAVPEARVAHHDAAVEEHLSGLGEAVPYDENLLERARTQWQFGDWDSLANIGRDTLQHHPDRAKLALLAAAGHLQKSNSVAGKQFIRLAQDWGCSQKLMAQVLIAGVHNTLGRAYAIANQMPRALKNFESAVVIGAPGSEVRLITRARVDEQTSQVGASLRSLVVTSDNKALASNDPVPSGVSRLALACLESADVHDAIDAMVANRQIPQADLPYFFLELAQQFFLRKDRLTALHFLELSRQNASDNDPQLLSVIAQKFVAFGAPERATDIVVIASLQNHEGLKLTEAERLKIQNTYDQHRSSVQLKSEHGQDLLLTFLRMNLQSIKHDAGARKPVVIEIGSTRENVPGQGSTRKIAEFCKTNALDFITVDMDPHNTRMAMETFRDIGVAFKAVTAKGEDYLRDYHGAMDFVFLDAYDFDHGQHSELRQSRYTKYLGSVIDDRACHLMHLDCAKSIALKLSEFGAVCLDDTWLEGGNWVAKGTLAMPSLLASGFILLEMRNRAALLARSGHGEVLVEN